MTLPVIPAPRRWYKLTSVRDILKEIENEEVKSDNTGIQQRPASARRSCNRTSRPAPRRRNTSTVTENKKASIPKQDSGKAAKPELSDRGSHVTERREAAQAVVGRHDDDEYLSESESDDDTPGGPLACRDWLLAAEAKSFRRKLYRQRCSPHFQIVMEEMRMENWGRRKQREDRLGSDEDGRPCVEENSHTTADDRPEVNNREEATGSDDDDDDDRKRGVFREVPRDWKTLRHWMGERRAGEVGGDRWRHLGDAVAEIAGEQRTREDMYRKYLYNPNSWADGLTNYPAFLGDRPAAGRRDVARIRPNTACALGASKTRRGNGKMAASTRSSKVGEKKQREKHRPQSGFV